MTSELAHLFIITACVIGFMIITSCGIFFILKKKNNKSDRNTYIEI